jgi:hypothetical protein
VLPPLVLSVLQLELVKLPKLSVTAALAVKAWPATLELMVATERVLALAGLTVIAAIEFETPRTVIVILTLLSVRVISKG